MLKKNKIRILKHCLETETKNIGKTDTWARWWMFQVNRGSKHLVFHGFGGSWLFTVYFTHAFKKETVLKYNLTLPTESPSEDQIHGSASK